VATTKKPLIAAGVLILLVGAFAYFLRYSRVQPDRGPDFAQIPYQLGQWTGVEQRFGEITYDVLAADTTTYRVYRDPAGRTLYLFIAYFKSQKYGGQIHSPRHCLPGSGWAIESREERMLAGLPGTGEIPVNLLKISQDQYTEYMWYWFVTRGGVNPSEYGLKLDLMLNSVQLRPTDAVFVRFNTFIDDDPAVAEQIGRDFAARLLPYLELALPFGATGERRDG
jgi:EpsI family protein